MGRKVRIPRHAGKLNAIYGLGVDMNDGALAIIGVVSFISCAIAQKLILGLFLLIFFYFANKHYLVIKKGAVPGVIKRLMYKYGWSGYSSALGGKTKVFFGDNKPVWIGASKFKQKNQGGKWNT